MDAVIDVDIIGVTPEESRPQANIANDINTLKQMQTRWLPNHPINTSPSSERLNKLRAMQA